MLYFPAAGLICYALKSTGVTNPISNGCVPFSCARMIMFKVNVAFTDIHYTQVSHAKMSTVRNVYKNVRVFDKSSEYGFSLILFSRCQLTTTITSVQFLLLCSMKQICSTTPQCVQLDWDLVPVTWTTSKFWPCHNRNRDSSEHSTFFLQRQIATTVGSWHFIW